MHKEHKILFIKQTRIKASFPLIYDMDIIKMVIISSNLWD